MTFEEAVDLDQKPSTKKRIIIAGVLALAAVGTHWLPGRTIVPSVADTQRSAMISTGAASEKTVTGPNSLLGDAVADSGTQMLSATDMCQGHLDTDASVDQAGLNRLLAGLNTIPGEVAVPAGDVAADSVGSSATAVPEPRTAGVLLLAAAPIFIRRKSRVAVKA